MAHERRSGRGVLKKGPSDPFERTREKQREEERSIKTER